MKKLFAILLVAVLTSCGSLIEPPKSNLEPPKSNTDYKNIIGNPIKIDKLEVAQYDFPIGMHWDEAKKICDSLGNDWRMPNKDELNILLYVVKESGQFSCRGFRCLNVGFFLLKIVVFVFLGTVV